jgi:hypothetical protein
MDTTECDTRQHHRTRHQNNFLHYSAPFYQGIFKNSAPDVEELKHSDRMTDNIHKRQ